MHSILLIAGTRPNFIKLAPLYHRLCKMIGLDLKICHTGQHFDFNMSDIFWQHLELPVPDFQLNVKGDGVADTIGKTIISVNEVVKNHRFDLIIVFGDVNATAAGAIVGAQSGLKVMHVEAGLRSYDRAMPEEINRIITDHICDYLMISEPSGETNLKKEGFDASKFFYVGNIMIESLIRSRPKWENTKLQPSLQAAYESKPVVATFHRPENVDNKENLQRVVDIILSFASNGPLVFPLHPRTKARMLHFGLLNQLENNTNILLTDPLGYFEFLKLMSNASLVITDSGGVQEETSFLNIPCVTFRKNTERPVTCEMGTNLLMSIMEDGYRNKIDAHVNAIQNRAASNIPLWDDEVSTRIGNVISTILKNGLAK